MYYVRGFSFSIPFDSSSESLGDALNNLLEDETVRALVNAVKHETLLQLMFNEACRRPLLIPLDIRVRPLCSRRSLTLRPLSSEFDRLKADLCINLNLFSRYSNMFYFIRICWLKCIETSSEMPQ